MTKKEKAAVIAKISGGAMPPRKRRNRAKKARNPQPQKSVQNPAGRAKRRRGNKGKRGRNNQVTTAGNMRSFIIPIDEQIQVVNGSTGFGIATFAINPGNPACFPFASRTAQNYERYEFQSLRFEYKPSASVFATVGAQGFVGVTGTMDALQATPSSQQQAEVMHHSPIVETARPTGLTFPKPFLETKSARECFFVRPNGSIPGGADPHLYDCGQAFFWTNGQANTNQIGEFRVIGSCKLINPVLETSTTPSPQFQVSQFVGTAGTGLTTATPVNVAFEVAVGTGGVVNALSIVKSSNVTFTPPVGNYLVEWEVHSVNTGNGTIFQCELQKNGGFAIGTSGVNQSVVGLPSGAYTDWTLSQSLYVSANGTDVFNVVANNTFSTGTSTAYGTLRFIAV